MIRFFRLQSSLSYDSTLNKAISGNYMEKLLSLEEIDKVTVSKCDIRANTEFLCNSAENEQLFSFACFLKNVLCQALGCEYEFFFADHDSVYNHIPKNIKKYSYDIHEEMKSNLVNNVLKVKSHCIIIMPIYQLSKISKFAIESGLVHYISLYCQSDQDEMKTKIISDINNKINKITSNFIDFTLDKRYLNNHYRIYISILYFKANWLHHFDKCDSEKMFMKFNGTVIMRKYIETQNARIYYKQFITDSDKKVETFILPFHNSENHKYKAIYISPQFIPSKIELTEIYTQFINECTAKQNEYNSIEECNFDRINANIFIPEFDHTCNELDLIRLLPEIYQGGPAYFNQCLMKLRVKIDEKGVEGAAVCATDCVDGINLNKRKTIHVNNPYIMLIYDDELRQSLFLIKDSGLD